MSIVNSTFKQDSKVVFSSEDSLSSDEIADIRDRWGLRYVNLDNAYESAGALGEASFILYRDSNQKLELWNAKNLKQRMSVDFSTSEFLSRLKTSGKNQPLAKAVGVSKGNINILDATGGLGGDAFILASLGCEVTLVERNPIVYLLLENGLQRALKSDVVCKTALNNRTLLSEVAQNIKLHFGEATDFFESGNFDVIYLDPMYPAQDKSALSKKEMQMLDLLVGEDYDQESLFEKALDAKIKRVVIKRPIHVDHYGKPTFSYESNSTRYDMYQVTV